MCGRRGSVRPRSHRDPERAHGSRAPSTARHRARRLRTRPSRCGSGTCPGRSRPAASRRRITSQPPSCAVTSRRGPRDRARPQQPPRDGTDRRAVPAGCGRPTAIGLCRSRPQSRASRRAPHRGRTSSQARSPPAPATSAPRRSRTSPLRGTWPPDAGTDRPAGTFIVVPRSRRALRVDRRASRDTRRGPYRPRRPHQA